MQNRIKTEKLNKNFVKEFTFLSILFFIMLAISLPITIAWLTDSFSNSSTNNINFGSVDISGSETISLSLQDAEGISQNYSGQALFPGASLGFSIDVENSGEAPIYLLAGCGISIYYVPSDFTLSNDDNASTNASLIMEDAKKADNKCIDMTNFFVNTNNWIDYTNIGIGEEVLVNNYNDMAYLEKSAKTTLSGSLNFDLSMPTTFNYESVLYELMDNFENFYLVVNIFVETLQAVEVEPEEAYFELQSMITTTGRSMGAKGY